MKFLLGTNGIFYRFLVVICSRVVIFAVINLINIKDDETDNANRRKI